VAETCQWRFT